MLIAILAQTRSLADEPVVPIKLKAGAFTPGVDDQSPPDSLTLDSYGAGTEGYYLLQFRGAVQQSWKDDAIALGAEFLGYIPENAFKVRMTPEQAELIARLDSVHWLGLWQPAYKVSPSADDVDMRLYKVRIESGANTAAVLEQITTIFPGLQHDSGPYVILPANSEQVQLLAHILDVAWIEPYQLPEKHNEAGGGVIIGSALANANGYDGSTQIVAVADTGLGDGTAAGAHPDIPASRISGIFNWAGSSSGCFRSITDDGSQDVDSGHGTHVSTSVLGDGGTGGVGKGVASAASLVFQSTENYATIARFCARLFGYVDGYYLTGLPDDLSDLFGQAYNAGARIHSNSWGSSVSGDYTSDSVTTDQFMWNNPDMLITFSAGNVGEDSNNDGVVDNDSIDSPATAKNVLTVGASENERPDNFACDTSLTYTSQDAYQSGETCTSMAGTNILGTAGARWGFTTEPMNSDLTAGNKEQMAPFSSRGPTDDGRIKPDVVAPGTWILSGYSDLYQQGYDASPNPTNDIFQWDGYGMPLNSTYKYMGGTSMSNPLAAGAAAVVRDFYKKTHDLDASAALVKATLINSAVDLLDENNDGVNDNDFPIPNVHEGWGRIDVNAATDGSHLFVENTSGLNTNGTATYLIEVASSTQPFRVSLVWTDYPASEAAATALVNNLDLKLTAPNSSLYRGNVFSGGWSQTGGSGDSLNNVENVYVQSPATGVWTVEISGTSVSNGSQPFALVLDGDFSPLAAPSVAIAIDSNDTTDVVLSWPNNPAIDFYDIWRGQNPYLTAGDADATSTTVVTTSDPVSYIDDGAAGNPAQNQFYVVHSVSILGQTSNGSSRKGVFTFGLTPGSPVP